MALWLKPGAAPDRGEVAREREACRFTVVPSD
jgi:hypothetical protein